jgi:hypothetical protein
MRGITGTAFKFRLSPSALGSAGVVPRLAAASALVATALLATPAVAVTFDISTLNVNGTTVSRPHFPICPCTDPVSGTTIFSGTSNSQTAYGWTEGTGSGAATIYFMGGTRGNNSGKIYVPTGGGNFPLPGSAGGPAALSGTRAWAATTPTTRVTTPRTARIRSTSGSEPQARFPRLARRAQRR